MFIRWRTGCLKVDQTATQFAYKMVDIRPQEVLTNMHFAYKMGDRWLRGCAKNRKFVYDMTYRRLKIRANKQTVR